MKIAVIGAGVMGLTLAQQLVKRNHQLEIFEKDSAEAICSNSSAAFTAAGMLAPFSEMESADPLVFRLGCKAIALWKDISETLGDSIDYRQAGSLILAHPQDEADLEQYGKRLSTHIPKEEQRHIEHIDHAALSNINPELAKRFRRAIHIESEACLSPPLYINEARRWLRKRGVKFHSGMHIEHARQLADTSDRFDFVIDCRGMGAKNELRNLRGVRGETILLKSKDVRIDTVTRLIHPRYRLYLAPRLDGHYIIGATEIESNDTGPITVRSALELLSAAYSIDPSFAEATIIKTAANCRPAFPDNAPKVLIKNNLLRVNGLYRHGLLIAPAIAEQIADYIEQDNAKQLLQELFADNEPANILYA